MLGREVTLPNHIIFPIPKPTGSTPDDFVSKLRSQLEEVYNDYRLHLKTNALRQKKDYDTRISQNQYNKGSLVYKYNNFFKKLHDRWSGPFIVVDVISPVLYKIRNRNNTEIIYHDRLKPYQSDDVPRWVEEIKKNL